ncbi:MAG: LacI family DNA-binding transcriptional regulator [Bryobacteraceae bacterium]|jgi:DNA-binding LacI/PurR family transcriptional regulator
MKLEDVAQRAKVSMATVSRVLNASAGVRSSTRARVLKAVKELNYTPNLHAQTLAGVKSRTLGMIVSNLENPFFLDIFRALEADAHRQGYDVIVANTDYEAEQLVSNVRLMLRRRVAGLAVIVSEMEPSLIQELTALKLPVVFYDVGAPTRNISNIKVNYRWGIERLIEYLRDLGHRQFAFIGHHTRLAPLSERQTAFQDAMARYGPEVRFATAAGSDGFVGGRRAARELLASGFRPSAIVCVNDFMAAGVLRELREQGLRVPVDVSVTGFDNISLSEFVFPSLTTVNIPRSEIGRLVFRSLTPEHDRAQASGREIYIETELVVRESTCPAPSLATPASESK